MGEFEERGCGQERDDFEENLRWKQGKVICFCVRDLGSRIFGRGPLEDDLLWRRLLGSDFLMCRFLGACHVTVGVRY